MRAAFFLAASVLAAAAVVACVATGDNNVEIAPEQSDSARIAPPIAEAGPTELDAGPDASSGLQTCSDDGWCVTTLPDSDLVLKDVWTLPGRAFAVAESATLGVKFLEWVDGENEWSYIDDNTQNEDGRGRWAGKIWAPSENEVYFGVSPNYVFRGSRTAPGSTWAWGYHALGTADPGDPDNGNPQFAWKDPVLQRASLGIWGTSTSDVYAWFKNAIYHWTSVDGGPPEWIPVYVAVDTDVDYEQMYFFAAAGTNPDEVWFSGARQRGPRTACALLVRRTSAGFERIADGINGSRTCKPRPGVLFIGGAEGWLTDLDVSANELVALKGGRDVVKISHEGGAYSFALAPSPSTVSRFPFNSLSRVVGDLWLGGERLILRANGLWDGGAYEPSLISMNGAALATSIYQVRGTSNTNLWAVGSRYALHKTTP